MKITLFTSNQKRHNFFINYLSGFVQDLSVIQECKTIFPGKLSGSYKKNTVIENYFKNVKKAEDKIFSDKYLNIKKKNIKLLPIAYGDLNSLKINELKNFLNSDLYLIFGSSFIKGELANFLVKRRAINIHIGVSPYYRGADCNFWALFDGNPHLVGATVHILSKGVDDGDILYHSMPKVVKNSFEFTMLSVKSAFYSLSKKIKDNSILKIKPIKQFKKDQIRYSTKKEFDQTIVRKFIKKNVFKPNKLKFNKKLLINPYFLK